ncbi:MAG: LPS assembly protein LptD, partial [Bdellovibrionia bacterium]
MNSFLRKLAFGAALLFSIQTSAAQKVGTLLLDAEEMLRDGRNQIIRLDKNVQIIFGTQHLKADRASIDLKTKTIHAEGHLVLVNPESRIEAERISMEYEKNTGVLYAAFVEMGNVSFEGEVIYKTGPKEFEVMKGSYTACTTCPPAWNFSGTRMTAVYGGYAHIRNAVFRVASVPVFWLPYIIIPLNSKRQTGFLFPKFEYGEKSQLTPSESFFWAMSDSTDSTWTLKNYQARGLKGLLNYRYVLAPGSRGEFDGSIIQDKVFPGANGLDPSRKDAGPINRYLLKYRHLYEMPEGYVQRVNLNLVSDLRYPLDFSEELEGDAPGDSTLERGDPSLENRISITKNTQNQHTSVDASVYTNLLKSDPLADNTDAVHRFPTVRYSASPQKLFGSRLLFQFDMNYTNFTRDSLTFDEIEVNRLGQRRVKSKPDGVFSGTAPPTPTPIPLPYPPGVDDSNADSNAWGDGADQIRAGQRIDIQPTVSYPFRVGPYFDFLPSIGFRDTGYQFSINDRPNVERRLVRGQISARTRFGRVFGDEAQEATRYKHEVQPELIYTSIPWLDQPKDHPFFGTVEGDPAYTADQPISNTDVIQFDYEDRLYDRNLLKFVLGNYVMRRQWDGQAASYKQVLILKMQQSYDFFEANRVLGPTETSRQPWSDLRTDMGLSFDRFVIQSTLRYFHYVGKASNSTSVGISDARGDYLGVAYSQSFNLPKGSGQITGQTEDYSLVGTVVSKFIQLTGKVSYSVITKQIQERTMNMLLLPTGDCWGIHLIYDAPIQG